MTPDLDAIRDRVAELKGWEVVIQRPPECYESERRIWSRSGQWLVPHLHPFPATLDGAASAMPEGWEWYRSEVTGTFYAYKLKCEVEAEDDNGEIHARYLLALRAMEAR